MTEYIDREALHTAFDEFYFTQKKSLRETINYVPAADVKPVVRGKWISRDKRGSYVCSICGDEWVFNPDHGGFCYCPTCGADMRGGEKE